MFRTAIISTVFAAAAVQVHADHIDSYDLSILPADVAERVVEMQRYGDRFEATIHAIFVEAMKPNWSPAESEPRDAKVAADTPQN